MGYRIHYGTPQKTFSRWLQIMRLHVLILVSFLAFLFLVNTMWPEGAEYIRDSAQLFRTKTASALNILKENLDSREPLVAVFSEFFSFCVNDLQ